MTGENYYIDNYVSKKGGKKVKATETLYPEMDGGMNKWKTDNKRTTSD